MQSRPATFAVRELVGHLERVGAGLAVLKPADLAEVAKAADPEGPLQPGVRVHVRFELELGDGRGWQEQAHREHSGDDAERRGCAAAGRSSGEITDEEAAQKVLVEYFEKNPDHLPTSNGRRFFCIASYTDRAIIKFSIQENLYDLSTIFSPLRFFLDRNGGKEPKCTIRHVSLQ